MTDLVFVRHGATELAGTFCGWLDPPLNDVGRQQACDVAAMLNALRFDAVFSSDLLRARATAEALASATMLAVQTDAALREIGFGTWEGLTWAQIEARDAAYARRWTGEFPALPAPGGEDFSSFEIRLLQAVSALRSSGAKCVAVVTHGGVMRVVLERLGGISAADAWAATREYTSCFRLAADGSVEVLR